ncbi:MAG: long-chain fatty acid--CoA ligase [Candidatus Hydrogenedentes bacterium]|nr:long-chain fatty acid--CoA ligase [Candidatus Hydrogenedentota bacterium]
MLNLATLLESSAREFPGRTAVVLDPFRLSYAEVDALAAQVASGLRAAGIHRGDKVALCCPNIPYFPIVYYGILKAGAVVVPINVLLKRRELAFLLEDSDARAFFCFEGTEQNPIGHEGWAAFNDVAACDRFWMITVDPGGPSPIDGTDTLGRLVFEHEQGIETVPTRSDDTAVIMYTSGTTGRPKGAELSHSNLVMNALVSRDLVRANEDDITVVALPLFHALGQTTQMNMVFLAGATAVLLPRFNPSDVLRLFQEENATLFCGVPTMYRALLQCPEADSFDLDKIAGTLRVGVSGGAAMPVDILRQFEERFNVVILEGYGLSETSPVASFHRTGRPRKPGSVGEPVWGVEMRIVDEEMNELPVGEAGEIVIRGHNVMKGYYKHPEATDQALRGGWFHSGDVGKQDEDGYFYIVDRTKDLIIRGGVNVYPREIEEVLMSHPDISVAAVVGVPDDKFGEEIKAFVVPVPKVDVAPEDVIAWARNEMARFKVPRYVEIRKTLPVNAIGKVLKSELRKEG